ncbi:MAG: helix-hairpin-helix domain-containing protein [Bacteroidales bacterium]|nr:helix-hairpin-helix domain-containing protein [Bacteroidales bacterium]
MNKPTRGQWRGYAALSVVLLAALLLVIVLPGRKHDDPEADHTAMTEAITRYGDSLVATAHAGQRRYRSQHYQRPARTRDDSRNDDNHDATRPQYEWKKRQRTIVELNSADTLDLQQLYGIGPSYARRIVKYRQRLGGFVSTAQLLEVYGMDEERYNGFVDQLTLDTTLVTKIDINSATLDDLKRHPYIDYYQAKAIVQFRDQHGPYRSPEELLLVGLVDDSLVTKMAGYVQFNLPTGVYQ